VSPLRLFWVSLLLAACIAADKGCDKIMNTVSRFGLAAAICMACFSPAAIALANDTPPVVTPGSAAPGSQAYSLRYKFVAGNVLNYAMSMDTQTAMAMNGQPMAFNMQMALNSTQTVDSVSPKDGSGVVTTKMTAVSGTMNGSPLPPTALQTAAAPMSITMSPTGGIIDDGGLSNPQNPMSFMGGSFLRFGAALPTQAVRPGDSWTFKAPMPQVGLNFDTVMTLKGVQLVNGDSIAEIDGTISSTPSGTTAQTPMSAMLKGMTMNMTGTTVLMLDLDKGIMDSMSSNMRMTMILPTQTGASPSQPMHTNMKMAMNLVPATN
jgi:hypothetical protein